MSTNTIKSILVILPNWLGDAVMATPAIEALCEFYPHAKLTLVGSFVSIEALKYHPFCHRYYVDETKKGGNRLFNTYAFAKKLGRHDIAISFRNQVHASLLLRFTGSTTTIARDSWHAGLLLSLHPEAKKGHLVEQYVSLVEALTKKEVEEISPLRLFIEPHRYEKATLGINPGATYGSAKRWYPEKFAKVAAHYADRYDIVIFGGPSETEMAKAIEEELLRLGIANFTNLAGKTSIKELCSYIGGLSLFVTNDSGPMHVAAAYQVPTVAIFGPTRHLETSQWKNRQSAIVRHDLECAPCMKRECPLKHHDCMKKIEAEEVIEAIEAL
jgi:heptosyltransferase-2